LAVVAPQADGKEARKERAPIHFPVGHGLLLRNTTAKLAPHGACIGALPRQNETGEHQHIQADAQQEEEEEVLFLQHGRLANKRTSGVALKCATAFSIAASKPAAVK